MNLPAVWTAAVLIAAADSFGPVDPGRDPLSVVQHLMEAERAADLHAALSLFAPGASITNVTGRRVSGQELRDFVEADLWLNDEFALESPRVLGSLVSWTRSVTAGFYEQLGVTPITFSFEAVVQNDRIKCIVAHFSLPEIRRIENACRARGKEPMIYSRPCSEFVEFIKTQMYSVVGKTGVTAAGPVIRESRVCDP
jgi:hypothetical protein